MNEPISIATNVIDVLMSAIHQLQGDKRSPGIIPLAVKDAFSIIQEALNIEYFDPFLLLSINCLIGEIIWYIFLCADSKPGVSSSCLVFGDL